jgi:hypothetical protein
MRRPDFETGSCFGIFDTQTKEWTLDCFDYPRLFETRREAEEYQTSCKDFVSPRYEVRPWPS